MKAWLSVLCKSGAEMAVNKLLASSGYTTWSPHKKSKRIVSTQAIGNMIVWSNDLFIPSYVFVAITRPNIENVVDINRTNGVIKVVGNKNGVMSIPPEVMVGLRSIAAQFGFVGETDIRQTFHLAQGKYKDTNTKKAVDEFLKELVRYDGIGVIAFRDALVRALPGYSNSLAANSFEDAS